MNLEVVDQQAIHFKFIRVVLIGVLLGSCGKSHVAGREVGGVGRVIHQECPGTLPQVGAVYRSTLSYYPFDSSVARWYTP